MCSKPIFYSKIALKGKSCSRLLKPQKVAPNAKSCSKVAEHNRDRPTEDSQDTNRVGDSVFQNGSPAMASDVLRIGKILISKLDRLRAKQPIRILKKSSHGMKTNPSGLKLCRRSDSICDSFPQRNIVHFELSRLIRISIRSS